jgi:hypothetical protein
MVVESGGNVGKGALFGGSSAYKKTGMSELACTVLRSVEGFGGKKILGGGILGSDGEWLADGEAGG